MKSKIVWFAIALVAALGIVSGVSAADYGYVPYDSPYGNVVLNPSFAGVVGLTVNAPQYSYGAIQTNDHNGTTAFTVSEDGQIWSHATGVDDPRLVLSSNGYDGDYGDVMQTLIGSSPVSAISAGGEIESYNYYVNGDSPRLSVRNLDDSLAGGIDGAGRFTTLAHNAPDPVDMANGEARVWYDTNSGLQVTMKDSSGNVSKINLTQQAQGGQTVTKTATGAANLSVNCSTDATGTTKAVSGSAQISTHGSLGAPDFSKQVQDWPLYNGTDAPIGWKAQSNGGNSDTTTLSVVCQ